MNYKALIFLAWIPCVSFSQDFKTGSWKGDIQLSDTILKVDLHLLRLKDSIFTAFLMHPTECFFCDSCFNGYELHLKSNRNELYLRNENVKKRESYKQKKTRLYNDAKFIGSLAVNKNQLNGELTLDDKVFPVTLFRDSIPINRPQEPKRPFPYYWEKVFCRNPKDSIVLAGTLTLPQKEGKFPVVIFQTGSVPSNRDGDGNHHKHTLVVADYLTRHGIGVLCYDSRGIGKSTGNFYKSTPLDLSSDLLAWKKYLASRKEIISSEIGIIGHSEGGMVAAMAASQSSDFNFIVMLGTPGLKLRDVFEEQTRLRVESGEMSREQFEFQQKGTQKIYKLMELHQDSKIIKDSLMKYKEEYISVYFDSIAKNPDKQPMLKRLYSTIITIRSSPHNLFNLNLNPTDYLEKVTCPVLSLSGSNDRLVPSKANQEVIRQALTKAGNRNFQIIELEGLNHNFQECEKGTITESLTLEQTFSPKALEIITYWILFHLEQQN